MYLFIYLFIYLLIYVNIWIYLESFVWNYPLLPVQHAWKSMLLLEKIGLKYPNVKVLRSICGLHQSSLSHRDIRIQEYQLHWAKLHRY